MFEHLTSKKFTIAGLGFVGELFVLAVASMNAKMGLMIPENVLMSAAGGIAAIAMALITGQAYSDAKTDGKTSSFAQAAFASALAQVQAAGNPPPASPQR